MNLIACVKELNWLCKDIKKVRRRTDQFVVFKPLRYCFEETIEFEVKVSFASHPVSRLISWYNKPGDITKEIWEKATVPRDFSWIVN